MSHNEQWRVESGLITLIGGLISQIGGLISLIFINTNIATPTNPIEVRDGGKKRDIGIV